MSQTDINERLPYFKSAMQTIHEGVAQGTYDGLSPEILRYLDGVEPVGLAEDGTLTLPDSYDAENGPPVLALQPGETPTVKYTWSNSLENTISELLVKSGLEGIKIPADLFIGQSEEGQNVASITKSPIEMTFPDWSSPFIVPRLLVLKSELHDNVLLPGVAHELDHWDYFLNEAALLLRNRSERLYKKDELYTMTERRAYGVSYIVERNLGQHALLPTIEKFATQHAHLEPKDAKIINTNFNIVLKEAGLHLTHSLSALAISHLFGRSDELVTPGEVTAYRSAGYY